jgi:putative ABC transport system substrate-binding protein
MRRREFIAALGSAAAIWPLDTRAQQSDQMQRIGILMPYAENDPETSPRVTALREALLKLGWTEGRNIQFEHRWSASNAEAIPKLAREIVDLRPDVILTDTTPAFISNSPSGPSRLSLSPRARSVSSM